MNRRTILVADDDRGMRVALGARLSAMGYRVIECSDGLGVVGTYLKEKADAIILDHEMPNGDGRSIARMIRNESDVPIVFLSGHDAEQFRTTVTQLPDTYFLPKPLDDGRLVDLLGALADASRKSGCCQPTC